MKISIQRVQNTVTQHGDIAHYKRYKFGLKRKKVCNQECTETEFEDKQFFIFEIFKVHL